MRIAFACLLTMHALIHLMGFVKAFELAPLTQLTTHISRPMGLLWLTATTALLAATVALFAAPRWFWLVAALGVVVSQVVVVSSWHDARFGSVANAVTLVAVVYGAFAWGPFGLNAEYLERTSRRLVQLPAAPVVTAAEVASLPEPVARYLRYAGVVGQPHVLGFRARFTGRIRSGPDAPWMEFRGEQHSFFEPPARFFSMQATMHGVPLDGLHALDQHGARMRIKLLSLIPMVDASGDDFTRAETVTLFNDMCVMAPATLVDAAVQWRVLDAHHVEGRFTNGPHTIAAVLVFGASDALVDFWSDDRPALAEDGVSFLPQRWSTPVGEYRAQGPVRLASRGEARYAAPSGEYTYIEFDDLDISYDIRSDELPEKRLRP